MAIIRTKPGVVTAQDGTYPELRGARKGGLVSQDVGGRYEEATYRKGMFTAYAAGQAISVVGTAMVGLQIWNGSPINGGINISLLKIGGNIVVTTATLTSIVLATGTGQVSAPTSQTAITRVTNNFIGGPAPQALATTLGTFTNAPTAMMTLLHNTAAIATTGEDSGFNLDLEGSIIIPPQTYVCFAAVGAAGSAGAFNGHIMWEEIPL
jgi:hypothetical protein